ncbi:hypothetical protein K435DRAFT_269962 [Dendrothele bispora CBS 962.96]|uniref:Uncharacterized protein n=1 Tax=Dendrothele bispora (strain CBS 962.96) TaxID=1314807 RepID=A0A4S8MLG0_DENBC|nr:hypothetical protein K435DRAFT_269962 [Dendrothele bispora CBS 962.96]
MMSVSFFPLVPILISVVFCASSSSLPFYVPLSVFFSFILSSYVPPAPLIILLLPHSLSRPTPASLPTISLSISRLYFYFLLSLPNLLVDLLLDLCQSLYTYFKQSSPWR